MKLSNSSLVLCEDTLEAFAYSLDLAKQLIGNIETNPDLRIYENTQEDKFLTEEAEGLIENMGLMPHSSEYKVYIIKNAESLTKVVQNKLLKTVEEPNLKSYIIFQAKTEEGILPTILSRVQKIKLNKQINMAEKLADETFKARFDYVTDVLENMKSSSEIVKFSRRYSFKKDELIETLKTFELVFNEILHNPSFSHLSSQFSAKLCGLCIKSLDLAVLKAYSNCSPNIVLDTFFIEILENKYLISKKD